MGNADAQLEKVGAGANRLTAAARGEKAAGPAGATARKGVARTVDLGCVVEQRPGRPSARTAAVASQFGLPLYATPTTIVEPTSVELKPGRLVLLLGPSGSGKSTALACIEQRFARACLVQRIAFPPGTAVIDRIAAAAPLNEALSIATACGLGEAQLWLRTFDQLSEGERFRARLARAVALHARGGATATPLLCDEFCSTLHRPIAKAIAFCLRKLVTRLNLSMVVAAGNDDIATDLQPDVLVRLRGNGRCDMHTPAVRPGKPFSLRRRLHIQRGRKSDYTDFAAMHYRTTDNVGFVDRVFVLRDGPRGELMGIVVYGYPPIELALRNRATAGRFSRNPTRLNRNVRILKRLVIHPDLRGCGIGHYLVRRTLPLVGTGYVECLAAMGEFNPVFEKAGMTAVGQCATPKANRAALTELHAMGVDPNAYEFPSVVARNRRVRRIVAGIVHRWYAATTAGGESRVQRQSPRFLAQTFRGLIALRPVYYLWRRPRKRTSTTGITGSRRRKARSRGAKRTKKQRPTRT